MRSFRCLWRKFDSIYNLPWLVGKEWKICSDKLLYLTDNYNGLSFGKSLKSGCVYGRQFNAMEGIFQMALKVSPYMNWTPCLNVDVNTRTVVRSRWKFFLVLPDIQCTSSSWWASENFNWKLWISFLHRSCQPPMRNSLNSQPRQQFVLI